MSGMIQANNRLYMNDQVAKQLGKAPLSPVEREAKREQDRLVRAAEKASAEAARKANQEAHLKQREERKEGIKEAEYCDGLLEAGLVAWDAHKAKLEPTAAKIKQLTHVISEDLKSIEELTMRIDELQQRKDRIVKERERKIDERTNLQATTHSDDAALKTVLLDALAKSNAAWGQVQPAKRKELRNRKAKRLALEILGITE